jgi:hypothetical protein
MSDWKPLVPQVPLTDGDAPANGRLSAKYEEAYENVIQGIKQLVSEQCPSVNFLEDTHKAGYQVINCKNVSAMLDTTQIVDDVQMMFQVKCKINLNMLAKNGPIVEILVPRRVSYGFQEKYSAWQRAQFVAGFTIAATAAYVAYAVLV